jgi:hypothetical protein
MSYEHLTPIEEKIAGIRKEHEEAAQAEIDRLIAAREALKKLCDADLTPPYFGDYGYIHVDLGQRILKRDCKRVAELLRRYRNALGPIKYYTKHLSNARKKLVRVTCRAERYPQVEISYVVKLSENSKCRIVKTRGSRRVNTSLVCEA